MKNSIKLSFYFVLSVHTVVYAEISTDGTVGAIKHLSGQMTIPQSLGITAGKNLFHSFQTFNINTGESATFTGDAVLKNVISRVTGGQISNINGLLKSEVSNANFYFINPAGVTFGANAQVDVPAAFHVSTTNVLKFTDGSQFSAANSNVSVLSIAEPASFGFLGNQAGDIKIQNAILNFNYKNELLLNAGNIIIDTGNLLNPSGLITINAQNNLFLTNNSSIDGSTYSFNKGGNILITAKNISLDNSKIHTNTFFTSNAGEIAINANEVLLKNNGQIASFTVGSGNAGDISVNAKIVEAIGNSSQGVAEQVANSNPNSTLSMTGIFSNTLPISTGNSGKVLINSNTLISMDGGAAIGTFSSGLGTANLVSINSNTVDAESGGEIGSFTLNLGNAGSVIINSNSISAKNNGQIGSLTFGVGNAGEVVINSEKITANNEPIFLRTDNYKGILPTLIGSAAYDKGNASRVTIKSDSVSIKNEGQIGSATLGLGNAGSVAIQAKLIEVIGNDSLFNTGIVTNSLDYRGHDVGNAGTINVNSDKLIISNGGIISSSTYTKGNAGDIMVKANTIHIYGKSNNTSSQISAAAKAGSSGQTGIVHVVAENIHLYDAGQISIQNNANVNNAESISAGLIEIFAGRVLLDSDSKITAQSTGNITAGQIAIFFAHDLTLSDMGTAITTQANEGNGGNLTINGGQLISLHNNAQIDTYTETEAKGGDIKINASTLIMDSAQIKAQADNANNGGDVNLTLNTFIPSHNQVQVNGEPLPGSAVGAVVLNSIQSARAGGVSLQAPQFSISGSMGDLSSSLAIPILDSDPCLSETAHASSLARIGKGSIPADEAKTVFVPAIADHTNANLHSQTDSTKQKILFSNKLIEQEKHPCMAISSDNNQLPPQNFFKE